MDIRKLEEEKQQLMLQLDDADKAGLEAETLLQARTGKIETLEKARNAAIQVCCFQPLWYYSTQCVTYFVGLAQWLCIENVKYKVTAPVDTENSHASVEWYTGLQGALGQGEGDELCSGGV